jgi:hypothetical protein
MHSSAPPGEAWQLLRRDYFVAKQLLAEARHPDECVRAYAA